MERADWILTKNGILQKVKLLLGNVQVAQQDQLAGIPAEVVRTGAKISRGENYRGLPYLVLDQPRYFGKEDVFAIRILFWWGHFFSNTLHLAGRYKILYEEKIIGAFDALRTAGIYICIHTEQWEHHFDPDNYVALDTIPADRFASIIRQGSFVKLAAKMGLERWEEAEEKLLLISRQYVSVLA